MVALTKRFRFGGEQFREAYDIGQRRAQLSAEGGPEFVWDEKPWGRMLRHGARFQCDPVGL